MEVGDKVFVKNQPCAAFKLTRISGDICTISGGGVTTKLSCRQLTHTCASNMSSLQKHDKVLFKVGDSMIKGKVIGKLSDGRYSIKSSKNEPILRRVRSSIVGIRFT